PRLIKIQAQYRQCIVHKVGKNGNEQTARPDIKVPEKGAEKKPRYEAEELNVKSAEQECRQPDGHVYVAGQAFKLVLKQTPKNEFFADGGNDGNYNQCDQEVGGRRERRHKRGQFGALFFIGTRPVFKTFQKGRKMPTGIPLDKP